MHVSVLCCCCLFFFISLTAAGLPPENVTIPNSTAADVSNRTLVYNPAVNSNTSIFRQWTELHLKNSLSYTLVVVLGYLIVFLVGITGNLCVVLINVLRPHIRTVKNLFILNLAVADLLLLVFCVIPTLLTNILTSWVLGSFMCKAAPYVQGVSVIASAYSIVALSFDRCKAITQKSLSRRGFTKTQAYLSIALIWTLALLLPLPSSLVFETQSRSLLDSFVILVCQEDWGSDILGQLNFFLVNLFLCYLLPCILISAANLIIWWKVANRPAPTQETFILTNAHCQVKDMHDKTKKGVGKMLGTVTLVFLFSWLPLYCIGVRGNLDPPWKMGEWETKLLLAIMPFAQWLAYWNSCINPIFYAFFNQQFRQLFKSLLPKCCVWGGSAVADGSNTRTSARRMTSLLSN